MIKDKWRREISRAKQEITVESDAIRILNSHRIMAVSTVRPDGWPQTTIVGYANVGLVLYFLIYRSSQKFANIQHDDRISIAVGEEPKDVQELNAVYAGAHAVEVTDPGERETVWRLLMERHSNLSGFNIPGADEAVFMKAACKYVSVLDFRIAPGHHEQLTINTNDAADGNNLETDDRGAGAT